MYAPNNGASKCMRQMQTALKGERDIFSIIIHDFYYSSLSN